MTFRHRAGVSPYTSSYDFAETCVFGKQSLGPFLCGSLGLQPRRPTPYRSTPSPEVTGSFCRVPFRGFSRSPWYSLPAHLCRFGVRAPRPLARGFSRQRGITRFAWNGSASCLEVDGLPDLPRRPLYTLAPGQPTPGSSYPPASPLRWPTTGRVGSPRRGSLSVPDWAWARMRWYWNINQSSIAYDSRPRLRARLTLGG